VDSLASSGALVTLKGDLGRDVCFAGTVGTQKRRQPGLADALKSRFSRGIACPRGSSRNRVTASAPKTKFRVLRSATTNSCSRQKPSFPCDEQVVDLAEWPLVLVGSCQHPVPATVTRRVMVQMSRERKNGRLLLLEPARVAGWISQN
jgi:hypothetical protein